MINVTRNPKNSEKKNIFQLTIYFTLFHVESFHHRLLPVFKYKSSIPIHSLLQRRMYREAFYTNICDFSPSTCRGGRVMRLRVREDVITLNSSCQVILATEIGIDFEFRRPAARGGTGESRFDQLIICPTLVC